MHNIGTLKYTDYQKLDFGIMPVIFEMSEDKWHEQLINFKTAKLGDTLITHNPFTQHTMPQQL